MTIAELKKACKDRRKVLDSMLALKELEFEMTLQLTMPMPKRFKGGLRIKTPFGLCRWFHGSRGIIIWPTLEQVENYINKAEAA